MIPERFMEFLKEIAETGEFEYGDGSPMTEDAKIALAAIMERQPFSTDERLPDGHSPILWWHPGTKGWRAGSFCPMTGMYAPGYFRSESTWDVKDGPTWWMPVPLDPRTPQPAANGMICPICKYVIDDADYWYGVTCLRCALKDELKWAGAKGKGDAHERCRPPCSSL